MPEDEKPLTVLRNAEVNRVQQPVVDDVAKLAKLLQLSFGCEGSVRLLHFGEQTSDDHSRFPAGRGTVTFDVDQNKRTITHLQSLSYPAEHYYFDRRLSNQQAVALAGGQSKPETIPGFIGRISKTEMLCPAWAGTKKALILAQLHWQDKR